MLQRVQKIIANAGICSRRRAEQLIEQGKVRVNGIVIKIGDKAEPFRDKIIVEGREVKTCRKEYIAFNKPADCLTTLLDPRGRKTIFSYLNFKERMIPIGRLDFRTEGLLLLTNDGDFANRVMHPRYEVDKTYKVFLDRKLEFKDLQNLREGVEIDDEQGKIKTKPVRANYASENKDVVDIIIHEGQNRIVRRMMAQLGYNVRRLIRTKVGIVELGELGTGRYRKLGYSEIKWFLK
jgi:23S rRNA pseudouridine2605 synthase